VQANNPQQNGGKLEQNGKLKSGIKFIYYDKSQRGKLTTIETRGFIGIQRQFIIMDDDNDKAINY